MTLPSHPGGTPLAVGLQPTGLTRGALVVLWAQAGPGDQVSGGREAAHVAADFGEDDASAQLVDVGNGSQELDRGSKGLDLSVDLPIDLSDGCVNRIDMLEEKTQREDDGQLPDRATLPPVRLDWL